MHTTEQTKYLRTPDAAERLGVSKSFLEKLRLSGDGPKFYRLGAAIIYSPADLDAWVLSRQCTSTSEY